MLAGGKYTGHEKINHYFAPETVTVIYKLQVSKIHAENERHEI